jgi:cytochrome b
MQSGSYHGEAHMIEVRIKGSAQSAAVWDLLIQLSGGALLILLIIAYATGEEYPHTYTMIGYAIAVLVIVNLLWSTLAPRDRTLPAPYTPRAVKMHLQTVGGPGKTLALLVVVLAALPICALLVMLVTHAVWGVTAIDEMHEVVAYFALGLVALHVVMVGIASVAQAADHLRKMSGHSRRGN